MNLKLQLTRVHLVAFTVACFSVTCVAAPSDGELWIATMTMKGQAQSMTQRVCQKPAGELEMLDLGALPKGCKISNMKRAGNETRFDFECKGIPGPASQMRGSVVNTVIDERKVEQTVTSIMAPSMPPMVMTVSGVRSGSCKLGGGADK